MNYFKDISACFVVAVVVTTFSCFLESSFLVEFLEKDLITILIALLAINTTTGSVVMTKLKEIADLTGTDFSNTIYSLKGAMKEQLGHILAALTVLVAMNSKIVLGFHEYASVALEVMLVTVFAASLQNLYDTANSIFVILNYQKELSK